MRITQVLVYDRSPSYLQPRLYLPSRINIGSPEISQHRISDIPKIQHNGILVRHDKTEKSDKALGHAIYQSKLSGAEIIILNVIEHVKTESSALIAISKMQQDSLNAKLEVTIYGGVKTMKK